MRQPRCPILYGGIGREWLARSTYIVSFRTAVLATLAGNDIFLAGLGMDALVFQADHALACL